MSKPNSTPLTAERLRELLHYDADNGVFTRLISSGANRAHAGDIAGGISAQGYVYIRVDGKKYKAHRLAFLHTYGRWPTDQIDHIDGDRANNRIANLREATNSENRQNLKQSHQNNKSTLLGVSLNSKKGKFIAQISVNKRIRYLGIFPTAELAHAAYLAAKSQLHPFSTM